MQRNNATENKPTHQTISKYQWKIQVDVNRRIFLYVYIQYQMPCQLILNTHSHKFRIDRVAHKVYRCLCVWIKSSVLDVYIQNVQLSTTSNKKASTFIQGIHTVQSTQRICERKIPYNELEKEWKTPNDTWYTHINNNIGYTNVLHCTSYIAHESRVTTDL